ncbi:metal-sensitive transcriptional regulator [Pseudonocardia acidicola]|uniref:Metal-sensitive transcriptional regulator n=1 Tax=Pseudonocardia acidicola TaxID=2724939 RepID=A0ABX1SA66_9PSEU|nr:metal-sensitive transcriptional regulator [Pseudonocardia acidicola]NMH98451.1 metal-sensitive transcriptional regulator [Pseudonocardia acidicola]
MNGYADDKDVLLAQLRGIEGQVADLAGMIESDTYCIDVLTQVATATRALRDVALQLLDAHLAHCVTDAAAQGGELATQKVREANAAIARLVKS